jgi:hypothetical protein
LTASSTSDPSRIGSPRCLIPVHISDLALHSYLSNRLPSPRAVSCGPSSIHRSPIIPHVHMPLHDTGSFSPIQSLICKCTRIGLLDPVPSHTTPSNRSRQSSSPGEGFFHDFYLLSEGHPIPTIYSASRIRSSILSNTTDFHHKPCLPSDGAPFNSALSCSR